jgi:hypothetical protein
MAGTIDIEPKDNTGARSFNCGQHNYEPAPFLIVPGHPVLDPHATTIAFH